MRIRVEGPGFFSRTPVASAWLPLPRAVAPHPILFLDRRERNFEFPCSPGIPYSHTLSEWVCEPLGETLMVCPNCHSEYTSLNPCDCSRPDFPPPPKRDVVPEELTADVTSSALKPTGISDPFWR